MNLQITKQRLAIGIGILFIGGIVGAIAINENSRNQRLAECNSGDISVCNGLPKLLQRKITNRDYLAKPIIKAANNCLNMNWCGDNSLKDKDMTLLPPDLKIKLDRHIEKWEAEKKAAAIELAAKQKKAAVELAAKQKKMAAEKAERATWGAWSYLTNTDEATGKPEKFALLASENSINLDFPYNGRQNARLILRSSQRRGFNVFVKLEKGQILCNTYSNDTLLVRFDDGPAVPYRCTGSASNSTDVAFIRNEAQFEAGMKRAKMAYITLNMYQSGPKTMRFKVKGYDSGKV